MTVLDKRVTYKPLNYPWAYEYYQLSEKMHWVPQEVKLDRDVRDWNAKMTPAQKNLVSNILKFFTQGDVDVAQGYIEKFMPLFPQPELRMMMSSFAAREAVHIEAYSLLIDTLGLPETEYSAFLDYEVMAAKHNYVDSFDPTLFQGAGDYALREVAKALAVYPAFTEGLQLFSSFVMLLSFQRPDGGGLMNGMGEVVEWSIKDESLHVEGMLKLFETFIQEYSHIWTDELRGEIYQIAREMVDLEDKFIDLAFEMGDIPGITKEEVKTYIRYIADRRLNQLGLKSNWNLGLRESPLPWVDEIINSVVHANFFESRATEYGKGAITGSWEEVWG